MYLEFEAFFLHSLENNNSGLSASRCYINKSCTEGIYYELDILLFLGAYMEKRENFGGWVLWWFAFFSSKDGVHSPVTEIGLQHTWICHQWTSAKSMIHLYIWISGMGENDILCVVSVGVQILGVTLKEFIKMCSNLAGLVVRVDM